MRRQVVISHYAASLESFAAAALARLELFGLAFFF